MRLTPDVDKRPHRPAQRGGKRIPRSEHVVLALLGGQAACPADSRTVKPSWERISAGSRASTWMSQRPAPCISGLAGASEPGQRVSWPWPGVVDADQDPPGCGPDPRGHLGAAVPPGVADGLRNADHEILKGRGGDLAIDDAGDGMADLGGRRISQLDGRSRPFERIGIEAATARTPRGRGTGHWTHSALKAARCAGESARRHPGPGERWW